MKYISKQFHINWRDLWNSLLLGIIVPFAVAVQEIVAKDFDQLSWSLIGKIFVGVVLTNLVRKFMEPSKVVEITALKSAEGDPLKPKKPPVKPED